MAVSCHSKAMTGNDLRDWRVKHGLMKDELAAKLGVSTRTVYRWEEQGILTLPLATQLAIYGLSCLQGFNDFTPQSYAMAAL